MLEAKLEGKEITVPEPAATAPVIDLMDALKKSVAQSKGRRGSPPRSPRRASGPRFSPLAAS